MGVTDTDTLWVTPDMDTDTARGPLMLLLRLPLIPITMVDTAMGMVMVCLTMVATDMATATEDTATTVKYLSSSSYLLQAQNQGDHQDLSVNKMDYVSLSSTLHQCYQFQCRIH